MSNAGISCLPHRLLTDPKPVELSPPSRLFQAKVEVRRLGSLAKHTTLDTYLLEGQVDGNMMRVLVADDGYTLDYIHQLVYPDGAAISNLGPISTLNTPQLSQSEADLVVIGANRLLMRLFEDKKFYLVPRWIRLFLPICSEPSVMFCNPDLDRQTRKYFRQLQRRIADGGFKCEITKDPDWCEMFYSNMYRPFAYQRHGQMAVIHSSETIKRRFQNGVGIAVSRNSQIVGGMVVVPQGQTLHVPHVGMVEGNVTAAREGAAAALDWYAVNYAYSIGCNLVNFGHTRAFLSDGVLRYKLTWGMQPVDDDDDVAVFAITSPGFTEPARQFFNTHPFFHLKDGQLRISTTSQK